MTNRKRLIGVAVLVALAALASTATAYFVRQSRLNAMCAGNLKAIGAALEAYAANAKGESYPLLSMKPGCIMFEARCLYPSYLIDPSFLISPVHPCLEELKALAKQDLSTSADDDSYWYTGFAFSSNRAAVSWLSDYRKSVLNGASMDEGPEFEDGYGTFNGEALKAARSELLIRGSNTVPIHLRYRLSSGIPRFFVSDIGNPVAPPSVAGPIPVMIERPELHGNGGHVLYLDGHVEFVPYPGPFPMTKEFIEGLRSLDRLEK